MKVVRRIEEGLSLPNAFAIGPSGDLFVANLTYGGPRYVTVYRPGGSTPVRRISEGSRDAGRLAVDSKGWLYVANTPTRPSPTRRGWVSVYAPGVTQPVRKITDQIDTPASLAIDPSDDLYVLNLDDSVQSGKGHQTVTVDVPGGTKLLQTITKGAYGGQTLIIGSP
jgi:sugar lactone lactonase YvrE